MQDESPSSLQDVDARLTELETKVCFQEQTLAMLNHALIDMRALHGRHAVLLEQLLHELGSVRRMMRTDPGSEPPPPHY